MRDRFALVVAAAGLAACGLLGQKEETPATSAGGGVQGAGRVAPATSAPPAGGVAATAAVNAPWIDPEPPGAQQIAEQVLSAAWNQDKVTHLTMSITTLVDTKTGLQGFRSAVAAAGTTLDERLGRLGAEVTGTEVTIRLPGSVLFDFDSSAGAVQARRRGGPADAARLRGDQAGRGQRDGRGPAAKSSRGSDHREGALSDAKLVSCRSGASSPAVAVVPRPPRTSSRP